MKVAHSPTSNYRTLATTRADHHSGTKDSDVGRRCDRPKDCAAISLSSGEMGLHMRTWFMSTDAHSSTSIYRTLVTTRADHHTGTKDSDVGKRCDGAKHCAAISLASGGIGPHKRTYFMSSDDESREECNAVSAATARGA